MIKRILKLIFHEIFGLVRSVVLLFCPLRYCNYIERDWNIVYGLVPDTTKEQFENHFFILNGIIAIYYILLLFDTQHMMNINPNYILSLVVVLVLIKGFEVERMMWRLTIGRSIDADTAHRIYTIAFESRPHGEVDILDIRYFLCDGLMRRDIELNTVKELVEIFPGYMNIRDRDGMSPFNIACQFASVDIVNYMLETSDCMVNDYVDKRGNTILHLACSCQSGRTYISLKVVNYLLEKQMSLVTVANNDGDLPIHVASDSMKDSKNKSTSGPEQVEIVWRLLLAYPDCLNCVGGSTNGSNEKDIYDKKNR